MSTTDPDTALFLLWPYVVVAVGALALAVYLGIRKGRRQECQRRESELHHAAEKERAWDAVRALQMRWTQALNPLYAGRIAESEAEKRTVQIRQERKEALSLIKQASLGHSPAWRLPEPWLNSAADLVKRSGR